MNVRTIANPYLKYWKISIIPASAKYRARSPKIAKTFEVYTINGSLEIPKIAGIESTANITSVDSITTKTNNNNVAYTLFPFRMKNLCP